MAVVRDPWFKISFKERHHGLITTLYSHRTNLCLIRCLVFGGSWWGFFGVFCFFIESGGRKKTLIISGVGNWMDEKSLVYWICYWIIFFQCFAPCTFPWICWFHRLMTFWGAKAAPAEEGTFLPLACVGDTKAKHSELCSARLAEPLCGSILVERESSARSYVT